MTIAEQHNAYLTVLCRAMALYAAKPMMDGWSHHPPMPVPWDEVSCHVRHECLTQAAKEIEDELKIVSAP